MSEWVDVVNITKWRTPWLVTELVARAPFFPSAFWIADGPRPFFFELFAASQRLVAVEYTLKSGNVHTWELARPQYAASVYRVRVFRDEPNQVDPTVVLGFAGFAAEVH